MYIPKTEPHRTERLQQILDICLTGQRDRQQLYQYRRAWTLFGWDGTGKEPRYNRLGAHTDLVTSFLYSADNAAYTVAAPRNSPADVAAQMLAVQDDWNDEFRDSGIAYKFGEALFWSLAYDSMFLKIGWNRSRQRLFATLVPPHNFAVYDEREPDLDSQQAFVHSYAIDEEDAKLRMARAGIVNRFKELRVGAAEDRPGLTGAVAMMVASGQRTSISDPLMGQVQANYNMRATYDPRVDTNKVMFHELYVWDDLAKDEDGNACGDYAMFHIVDPGMLLSDSREVIDARRKAGLGRNKKRVHAASLRWTDVNDFLPGEHPFVHVRPFALYDYFYGESHCERLTPLQHWTNKRLWEISEMMTMQVDPPRNFSGFQGLTDEKADALGSPGTWTSDQNPGAKVENLAPDIPEDLFKDVVAINAMFLEASGLTETVTGRGEQGVRGRGHAKQLATTGSARIRKTAVGLEPPLVKLADIALQLRANADDRRLVASNGMEFALSQTAAPWTIRIAGHSHSPLFADESDTKAQILFKAGAIDREMLVRMMRPPGEANILQSLKARMAREQQALARNPELAGKKKGQSGGLAALAA